MKKIFCSIFIICIFSQLIYAQLPSIVLKSINGKEIKMDTISNNNNPIIITFFATWCKPCNRELSAIADVYKDWQKETGVKLIAVSIDHAQNIQKVGLLVAENDWPYELIILDENKELSRALGIQMIPFVIILNGNGTIIYKHNGYTDGSENELIEIIRKYI